MNIGQRNPRVDKDALMGAAVVVDRLAAALDDADIDEHMQHEVRDGKALAVALRAGATGQPAEWPNSLRRRPPFEYERPEHGHDPELLAALRTMQEAVARVSAAWCSGDYAVLGTSYGLPLDFAEIASAVADWEIPNA